MRGPRGLRKYPLFTGLLGPGRDDTRKGGDGRRVLEVEVDLVGRLGLSRFSFVFYRVTVGVVVRDIPLVGWTVGRSRSRFIRGTDRHRPPPPS